MARSNIAQRTAPQTDAEPRVAYLIGRLERAVRRRISETLLPFKLSVAQYTALSVIRRHGESSNADLATRAFITPQAMNEVVKVLEQRKLVTRRPDPSHGRIVKLLLTKRGKEVLGACDAAVLRLEQRMLAGFTAAQREAFREALLGCAQALENAAS
ncbi:MAG TPA: MarR family transcriptional regulator [Steroidobacteraceae bacterium]|nr:MarR family transcriptional regulator [Steroidobacteraceae bacterium]